MKIGTITKLNSTFNFSKIIGIIIVKITNIISVIIALFFILFNFSVLFCFSVLPYFLEFCGLSHIGFQQAVVAQPAVIVPGSGYNLVHGLQLGVRIVCQA